MNAPAQAPARPRRCLECGTPLLPRERVVCDDPYCTDSIYGRPDPDDR